GSARAGGRAPRSPSPHDRQPGGAPPAASRACTGLRRPAPTARAAGRTRGPPPRTRPTGRRGDARSPRPRRARPAPRSSGRTGRSNLDPQGENRGGAPGSVVGELSDAGGGVLLRELDLVDAVGEAPVEPAPRLVAHLVEQRPRPGDPARDQSRRPRRD